AVTLLTPVAGQLARAKAAAQEAAEVLKKMQGAEAELKELEATVQKHKAVNCDAVVKLIAETRDKLASAKDAAEAKKATAGFKEKGLLGDGLAEIDKVKNSSEYKKLKEVRAELVTAKARLAKMEALPGAASFLPLKEHIDRTRNKIADNDGANATDKDG